MVGEGGFEPEAILKKWLYIAVELSFYSTQILLTNKNHSQGLSISIKEF